MNSLAYRILGVFAILAFSSGCSKSEKSEWKFDREIQLENITPVGIASDEKGIWLSDTKNNRLVQVDSNGNIIRVYENLQRPIHISQREGMLYVSEFLSDSIKTVSNDQILRFHLLITPDAPSSVDAVNNTVAVSDFYNHRIILQKNESFRTFGTEGHDAGQLYYPTDVELSGGIIYVADAYNNRVQLFDTLGKVLKVIGEKDSIHVATGIAVGNDRIFVTDFYGNRILIYDLNGNLKQMLSGHFDHPVDISLRGNVLAVANYQSGSIAVYRLEGK